MFDIAMLIDALEAWSPKPENAEISVDGQAQIQSAVGEVPGPNNTPKSSPTEIQHHEGDSQRYEATIDPHLLLTLDTVIQTMPTSPRPRRFNTKTVIARGMRPQLTLRHISKQLPGPLLTHQSRSMPTNLHPRRFKIKMERSEGMRH